MPRPVHTSPRYITDRPEQVWRLVKGALVLAAFVIAYSLGTFVGLLHP